MDENLIEHMEAEMEVRRAERPTSLYGHSAVHSSSKNQFKGCKAKKNLPEAEEGMSSSGRSRNGIENSRVRQDMLPETVVAVYAPSDIDIYSGRRPGDGHPYYVGDTTVSSIKCVMSTVLFLAVIAAIIVVAFVKNPGM